MLTHGIYEGKGIGSIVEARLSFSFSFCYFGYFSRITWEQMKQKIDYWGYRWYWIWRTPILISDYLRVVLTLLGGIIYWWYREIKNSWKIQDLVRSLYSFTTPSIKSIWCFSWIVLDMTDFSWVLQVKQIKIFLKLSTLLKHTSLLKFISHSSILDQVCCWWLHLLLRFYHYPSNYVLAWCCSL